MSNIFGCCLAHCVSQSQFADGIDCRSTTGFIGTPCGDAFVAELNPSGSNLIFSTYLGGSKLDYPDSLARDLVGNIYIAGFTSSSDFPTTPGVFQTTYQGNSDLFIAKISPSPNPLVVLGLASNPQTNVSLTFNSVSTSGTTAVTQTSVAPPAPSGFTVGSPAMYYELSTTATYSGNITVCFNYSGVTFPSGTPQLLHYQNGSWVNVTTSVDETNLIICGAVTSLSPFGVFNLGTQGLSPATYTLTITMPGGLSYNAGFVLK